MSLSLCARTCLQLANHIWDVGSNMMLVDEHVLWKAQKQARACTRLVQCVERIGDLVLTGDNQVTSKVRADEGSRAKVDHVTGADESGGRRYIASFVGFVFVPVST